MCAQPIGIGFIGTGGISRAHAKAYQQFPELAKIVAVCDVDAARAEQAREEFGASFACTDMAELLARPEVQAVSVTTPTALHAPAAIAALEAGKHVLCEKPMAASAAQAKAMVKAAEQSGKTLMIAMKWRFRPETLAARQAVVDGKLGDIYFARAIGWQHKGVPARPSFTRKELAGGGGMMDNGIYNLDTVLHILGHPRPLAVSAQVGAWIGPRGSKNWQVEDFTVEDFGACFVRLEGGCALFFAHSWHVNLPEDWGIGVTGTTGGLAFDIVMAKPLKILHGEYDDIQDITPDPMPEGNKTLGDFAYEIREFLTALHEGRPSPVPGDPFYYSNVIFDAAFESARQGREVTIEW
ncbi:MAG: Gfo/Idh/MocA family oxidoreductase [Armatimonadetes bacterium]|nr:Gfo/Idh/MocA family oxidoreductase [Armatimonadota bacterium]